MKQPEAVALARAAFRQHPANQDIPSTVGSRLSIGAQPDGLDWVFTVLLHDDDPHWSAQGLKGDLIAPRPKLIAMIRVSGRTGEATVTEVERL